MPIPASLGEGYGLPEVTPAGYSPEGAICQRGSLKHSVCRLEDFPTLEGLLERGWHGVTEVRKSQTPNFKANSIWKLQLFCEGTELEPGIGVCICSHRLGPVHTKGQTWKISQSHTFHSE